jgi:MFS transporter, DHA1 family, tetracycline resistance protein
MQQSSTPNLINLPEDRKGKQKKQRALALIFFVMMMDVMGISLLTPVAPKIALKFSDKAIMVTMITVMYAGGQFLATPMLGKLGDRYGRRIVLLISLVGQAVGYFIFGLGGSLWILFLGRLIGGITAGNLSTASAYIADISTFEDRPKNFAMIGTAWSMGLILGPALGGIFCQISLETPAFIASVLAILNVLLGIFLLPESLPEEKRDRTPLKIRDYNPILSILDMVRKPELGLVLLVYALFSFAFDGISSTSALFVIEKFTAQTWQISLMLIMSGISIAITNTFFVPRIIPKLGERISGISSLFGLGISYVAIYFCPFMWLVYPLSMISSFMNSFIFPVLTTLSADLVRTQELGTLMGVTSSVGSLMNILGPLWAGLMFDKVMVGAPYWMGTIIMVLTGVLMVGVSTLRRSEVREGELIP